MRDPHVVALHYRIETGSDFALDGLPPSELQTGSFTLYLSGNHLRAEITDNPATVAAAYREVERYLRAWEIRTNSQHRAGAIRFHLEKVDAAEGAPEADFYDALKAIRAPRGRVTLMVRGGPIRKYPDPPGRFVVTPDVDSMWERDERYKAGRELLTNVAWWCLTTIEQSSGGRSRAVAKYSISDNVLETLTRLAHVGDEHTARKRFANQVLRDHTHAEAAWMDAVIKRIIQRVGEWAADPNAQWPQITMRDCPKL
jgi:hypothetical protein